MPSCIKYMASCAAAPLSLLVARFLQWYLLLSSSRRRRSGKTRFALSGPHTSQSATDKKAFVSSPPAAGGGFATYISEGGYRILSLNSGPQPLSLPLCAPMVIIKCAGLYLRQDSPLPAHLICFPQEVRWRDTAMASPNQSQDLDLILSVLHQPRPRAEPPPSQPPVKLDGSNASINIGPPNQTAIIESHICEIERWGIDSCNEGIVVAGDRVSQSQQVIMKPSSYPPHDHHHLHDHHIVLLPPSTPSFVIYSLDLSHH